MKVALVYDDLIQSGGAEGFLNDIYLALGRPDLYTPIISDYYLQKYPKAFYSKSLSLLARYFFRPGYYLSSFFSNYWLETRKFTDYDRVVILSNRFSANTLTNDFTTSYLIVTTPNRYLWKHSGFLNSYIYNYKRVENYYASHRHNCIISISEVVQKRVKKYWGQESTVIHPPVKNYLNIKPKMIPVPFHNYYLLVGRINKFKYPYFAKILSLVPKSKNVIVVGSGEKQNALIQKYNSQKNIHFVGRVSDSNLAYLYSNCSALLHPQVEDFGLTPLEVMQFNKPVVAYKKGGVAEYLNSKTCYFYSTDQELLNILHSKKNLSTDTVEAKKIVDLHSFNNFEYNLQQLFDKYEKPTKVRF